VIDALDLVRGVGISEIVDLNMTLGSSDSKNRILNIKGVTSFG